MTASTDRFPATTAGKWVLRSDAKKRTLPLMFHFLDQGHNLGGEALHAFKTLLYSAALQVDHHVAYANLLVAFDVVSNLLRGAREGSPLTTG